jgi:hypothetical protein
MRVITKVLTMFMLIGPMAECSGMTADQQRMLSGGAIGAGAGAAIGAISGGSPVTVQWSEVLPALPAEPLSTRRREAVKVQYSPWVSIPLNSLTAY